MNNTFVILLMIFCHIVADYNLQGWLASAKTKEFWEQNAPDELYKKDYICALLMHSISWTFMIMLPIAYVMNFNVTVSFVTYFVANVIFHMIIDDAKANRKYINLITDQAFHFVQIYGTAINLL